MPLPAWTSSLRTALQGSVGPGPRIRGQGQALESGSCYRSLVAARRTSKRQALSSAVTKTTSQTPSPRPFFCPSLSLTTCPLDTD